MKKSLPFLATFSLAAAFTLIFAIAASAQEPDLSADVIRQIQALSNEKQSRTTAQKKVDSNLLYAIKKERREAIAAGIESLETGVNADEFGRVEIIISAEVSKGLISALNDLKAEIISSYPEYRSISVRMPLSSIETLAARDDVTFISPRIKPTTNRTPKLSGVFFSGGELLNFGSFFGGKSIVEQSLSASRIRSNILSFLSSERRPEAGTAVAQGDATHGADTFRARTGFNGTGVKIGVLSDGVDSLVARQASGELPASVTVLPGQAGEGDEGTAMLEIVHDMAPGAQLYFATGFNDLPSFANNVRALRAAGCDIIIDDVSFANETAFQNGQAANVTSNGNGGLVVQAVNDVTVGPQAGAMFFSSAANSGNKDAGTAGVWEGDFVDGGTTGGITGQLHNFGGFITNTITADGGVLVLQWSDPLGGAANDYDLYVVNSAGTTIVAQSTNMQTGTQDPVEVIDEGITTGRRIVIAKKSGAARFLHLNTNRGKLSISTSGVTFGHNAGLNTIGVAATPAYTALDNGPTGPFPNLHSAANKIEDFSSDGPRRIFFNGNSTPITPGNFTSTGGNLLQKPDITAADGVKTTTPGFIPFFGTSAAAPAAGALAALLKSAMPAASNAQILNAMKSSAFDLPPTGWDRNSGAGIVMPIQSYLAMGGVILPGVSINDVAMTEGNAGTKTFTFTVTLTNAGAQSITLNYATADGTATAGTDYVANNGTVTFNPGETTKTINITVNGDTVVEPNETFLVKLSNVSNAVITDNEGIGKILTDDAPPTPTPTPLKDGDVDADFVSRLFGGITEGSLVQNAGVKDVAVQTDGKAVIGGLFVSFANRSQRGIARINADGSPDYSFYPIINGDVTVITLQLDGKILIGGTFTQVNGQPRARMARLNVDGSIDPSFQDPDFDDEVKAIVLQGENILVGGSFVKVGGQTNRAIVRLNSEGERDITFTSPITTVVTYVSAIAVEANGKILAGGNISFGPGFSKLGRFNSDGTPDTSFTGVVTQPVNCVLSLPGGKILLGEGGNFVGGLSRLNANGSLDPSFSLGPTQVNTVYDFAFQSDGKLIVAGTISHPSGARELGRFSPNGELDTTYNPGIKNNHVYAVGMMPGDKVLAGGDFSEAGGKIRYSLVRLNTDSSLDLFPEDISLGSASSSKGWVRAITTQPDGKILIGGYFTNVSGKTRRGVARLNVNGTLDETFQDPGIEEFDNAGDAVGALAIDRNGKILVGGSFQVVNGAPHRWLIRLHPNGALDTSFNPVLSSYVATIGIQADDKLVIGGRFEYTIGGQSRTGMARLNPDGSIDPTFNRTTFNYQNYTLDVLPSGKILAQGSAPFPGASGLARYNPDGSLDADFTITELNSAQIKKIRRTPDDKIIIVGNFFPGIPHRSVARFNSNGTHDTSFQNADFNGTVSDAAVQPDGKVIVVGTFLTVNGQNRRNTVRLNTDGSVDPTFIALSDAETTSGAGHISNVWIQNDGRVLLGGEFRSINRIGADYVARLLNGYTPPCSYSANPPDRTLTAAGGQNSFGVVAGTDCTWSASSNANWVTITSGGNGNGNGTLNYTVAANTSPAPRTATIVVTGQNLATTVHTITQSGVTCTYSINPTSRNFTFNGDSDNVTVTTAAGCAWTAVVNASRPGMSDSPLGLLEIPRRSEMVTPEPAGKAPAVESSQAGFILITSGSSGVGTGTVAYAVEPNTGPARTGTMTIAGQTFTVNQDAAPANINVTVQSNPAGRSITVDGTTYTSTQVLSWIPGSTHTISTTATQPGTAGTQYVFANWSDGGAISHTVNPAGAITYTANFTTQHQLTMTAGTGGTVSPATAFVNAGETVNITAFPNAGFVFGGWTGTGTGSFAGTTNPVQITVNGPITETAAFTPCTFSLNPTSQTFTAAGGTNTVGVTAPAGCAWTAVSNSFAEDAQAINAESGDIAGGKVSVDSQNTSAFTEGFTDITTLTGAGWSMSNQSGSIGTVPNWAQGNPNSFAAQSGPSNSYIVANFNNTANTNTISNWLMTPNISFNNGDIVTFYTRTNSPPQYPDRLQVRLSTAGTSTNVGTGPTAVGDFSRLMLDINPTYSTTGYPDAWTQYTITISGLAGPTSGRLAFRYFVENGGPTGLNSDYIGIDTFAYTPASAAGFINITSGTSGNGNGTVSYSVAANTGAQRTGTMTIAGQTFTVTQAAAGCSYTLSALNQSFTAAGGTGSFNVNTTAGCVWTAVSSDPSFVTITTGANGSGTGTVNFSVAANAGAARSGTITAGGQAFTVNQGAVVPIAVNVQTNPAGRSFTVDGVNFTSAQSLNWTPGSTHTISTTSPQAGTAGTQYVFANWSDSGAISHTVSPSSATTFTANFTTQHQLTVTAGTGGTVTPASGFVNAGQPVTITATPNAGFTFAGWTGTGPGSFTGSTNPVQVTPNGPITQTAAFTPVNQPGRRAISDFDGDRKSDLAVWRESNGIWFWTTSSNNGSDAFQFGSPGDIIVPGDYDGDGRADLAVYRPAGGLWYMQRTTAGFSVTQWGVSTDIPVPGDYDGDGKTDIAVWRPSSGIWFIQNSSNNQTVITQWGAIGDKLVPGDYDGDGKTDLAVYRMASGIWFIIQSTAGFTATQFGIPSDKVVPADYDGDGKTDLAVYRDGPLALWYLQQSTAGFDVKQWGTNPDIPVPGDYDGDGKADIAVWRPSNGIWFFQQSSAGFNAVQFGAQGDKLVPAYTLPAQ